jgi:hypothetical protein
MRGSLMRTALRRVLPLFAAALLSSAALAEGLKLLVLRHGRLPSLLQYAARKRGEAVGISLKNARHVHPRSGPKA